MYGRFLSYIMEFQWLVIFTVVSLFLVGSFLLIQMRDFTWTSKWRLLVINLFFRMPTRYMIYLAANYIQLTFTLSMLFTLHDVELIHLVFLVTLGIIQAVSIATPGESIRSFLGSILLYGAFLMVDLLKSYVSQVRFDWRIAFVCLLLVVFILLYSFYFFVNSIKCLAERTVEVKQRKEQKIAKTQSPGDKAGLIDLDQVDIDTLEDVTYEKERLEEIE